MQSISVLAICCLLLKCVPTAFGQIPEGWEEWAKGGQRELLSNAAPGPGYAPAPSPGSSTVVTFYQDCPLIRWDGSGDNGVTISAQIGKCTRLDKTGVLPSPGAGGEGTTGVSSWSYSSSLPARDVTLFQKADCTGLSSSGISSFNPSTSCYQRAFLDAYGKRSSQQFYNFNFRTANDNALNDHPEAFIVH